jgi:4-deoxy-L-threo-5-hexosulose-uronate ketol-isomerase
MNSPDSDNVSPVYFRRVSVPGISECATMTARRRREAFLLEDLFIAGRASLVHWECDRTLVGGVMPTANAISLGGLPELRATSFLERRELGVINLGGEGVIEVAGREYGMAFRDGLYLGRGSADPVFRSEDPANPACFYLLGYPAHRSCPSVHRSRETVTGDELGTPAGANLRTLSIRRGGNRRLLVRLGHGRRKPGICRHGPCRFHRPALNLRILSRCLLSKCFG